MKGFHMLHTGRDCLACQPFLFNTASVKSNGLRNDASKQRVVICYLLRSR